MEEEKEKEIKNIKFVDNFKKTMEAGTLCTIVSETFYSLTKNTWISNLGASWHITNNDTGFNDIHNINKSV